MTKDISAFDFQTIDINNLDAITGGVDFGKINAAGQNAGTTGALVGGGVGAVAGGIGGAIGGTAVFPGPGSAAGALGGAAAGGGGVQLAASETSAARRPRPGGRRCRRGSAAVPNRTATRSNGSDRKVGPVSRFGHDPRACLDRGQDLPLDPTEITTVLDATQHWSMSGIRTSAASRGRADDLERSGLVRDRRAVSGRELREHEPCARRGHNDHGSGTRRGSATSIHEPVFHTRWLLVTVMTIVITELVMTNNDHGSGVPAGDLPRR